MGAVRTDGRVERGNQTRRLVLGRAMEIASVEGLEGLSLGRLAGELSLSKSGVFALFGSKEGLQLAVVKAATEVYIRHVIQPSRELPPGVVRVWRLCEAYLRYSRDRIFSGGCFFTSVSVEFAARTGPVHDAIAKAFNDWGRYVEQTIERARLSGEFRPDLDVPQLAFEVIALMETADGHSLLQRDPAAYRRAGTAILRRLRECAVDPSALPTAMG